MSKDDVCYWCGNPATSKEHVPPKCLFPEEKDVNGIYDESFRKNLITVPSCDKHNLEKSHEDEYLMACLSGRVGNNYIAYVHNATKVRRARERNPNLLKVDKEEIIKLDEKELPVQWITVDTLKLRFSFEAIARALYFYEKNKIFNKRIDIVSSIFIHENDRKGSLFNIRASEMIEKEQPFWGTDIKGDNTDIFTYQFSPIDGFGCQTIALTFFKATKVYVILCEMNEEEIEKQRRIYLLLQKYYLAI